MKSFLLFCIALFISVNSVAQFTDRYWCFGDSAAIDFRNLNNPVPAQSVLRARGTCASICDSAGNLLFYTASPHVSLWLSSNNLKWGYILNSQHEIVENGDSIAASLLYQEMIIVPDPANNNKFYVFSAGVVNPLAGFFYSLIDLSYNNGLGKVIQKNVQLESFEVNDGLAAVKHGNGRDWWIIFKPTSNSIALDEFYSYLITPSGISGPYIQHIGSPVQYGGLLRLEFSKNGKQLWAISPYNLIESYDFDRCTGILSNVSTIHINNTNGPLGFWSFALSPDASKLYASSIYRGSNQDTSYLIQYDLNSSNVFNSADTLQTFVRPFVAGLLQIGPNDKIYLAGSLEVNDCDFNYLYCDTTRTNEINNLSVINSPDSLGSACNFQPFSFYLGGKRTYLGLPNNPNYELGADSGSVCDTVHVGLNEILPSENNLFVFYDAQLKTAFINANKLRGRNYRLCIYDITGREVITEQGKLTSEFYTRNLDLTSYSSGLYIVSITTEKEKLVRKFLKD